MSNTNNERPVDYRRVLRVAAAAECDPRTAERALRDGVDSIRTRSLRARLAEAIAEPQTAAMRDR